eukprot:409083-Pleurochrysis_carterae.AAC.2
MQSGLKDELSQQHLVRGDAQVANKPGFERCAGFPRDARWAGANDGQVPGDHVRPGGARAPGQRARFEPGHALPRAFSVR